jgi:hypothetical protein
MIVEQHVEATAGQFRRVRNDAQKQRAERDKSGCQQGNYPY